MNSLDQKYADFILINKYKGNYIIHNGFYYCFKHISDKKIRYGSSVAKAFFMHLYKEICKNPSINELSVISDFATNLENCDHITEDDILNSSDQKNNETMKKLLKEVQKFYDEKKITNKY